MYIIHEPPQMSGNYIGNLAWNCLFLKKWVVFFFEDVCLQKVVILRVFARLTCDTCLQRGEYWYTFTLVWLFLSINSMLVRHNGIY